MGAIRRFGALAAAFGLGTVLVAHVTSAPVQLASSTTPWAVPAAAYGVGSVLNTPVTMADGIVLRADVYYPTASPSSHAPAAGAFPVLLEQTPYGKQNVEQDGSSFATDVAGLVGQGYIVVLADVRGTGTSGGTWGLLDPVQDTDGATLVLWAADELCGPTYDPGGTNAINAVLPAGTTTDGQVGLFGESYMGINEFLSLQGLDTVLPAVQGCDPSAINPVKAMFPVITGNDLYRDVVTEGGLFNTEFSAAYVALVNSLSETDPLFDPFEGQYVDSQEGTSDPSEFLSELEAFLPTALTHSGAVLGYDLPATENLETGGDELFDADEGFADPSDPAGAGYWAQRNPVNVLAQVVQDNIATFVVGGWNDLFQRGELMNYAGLQNEWYDQDDGGHQGLVSPMAPGQPTSPMYQLMMGPWTHLTAGTGSNMTAVEIEWFDSWMAGPGHVSGASTPTPLQTTTTPLHLYEMGSGQWNDAAHTGSWFETADWPLPSGEVPGAGDSGYAATKYYLGGPASPLGAVTGAASSLAAGTAPALSTNQGTLSTAAPTSATGADTLLWTGANSPCDLSTDQWGAGGLQLGQATEGSTFQWPCDEDDATLGAGPGAATYTTAPMKSDELLAGPIDVSLLASATTTDTEWVATVELVSPQGQPEPLTTGALLGSLRALDAPITNSWDAADGATLEPFHPFTTQSAQPVVPGRVTDYDLEVFPTFAAVPAGWSVRVTISTTDTPHIEPTVSQAASLAGGVYQIERNAGGASFVNLPLVPAATLSGGGFTACNPATSVVCLPGSSN